MYLLFNKEDGHNWFVELPQYPGPKGDLLMVAGTDKILDDLAENKNSISFKVSDQPFKGALHLTKVIDLDKGGAFYKTHAPLKFRIVWFCKVMLYVFGKHPKNLYFEKMI